MTPVRVFVADANELMRYALRTLLEAEPDMSVVGEVADTSLTTSVCGELRPDVVVLHTPRIDAEGEELCRRVASSCPDSAVLVIADCEDDTAIAGLMAAGACGYVLDTVRPEHVIHAVRTLADGQTVFDAGIAEHLMNAQAQQHAAPHSDLLSDRELEVLQLMAQGQSNKQIARSLWIGETTVKTHVSHILHKLGEADRTGAVLAGVKAGIVELGR